MPNLQYYKSNPLRRFFNYSFFIFLDKALSLLLPISILLITGNKSIYVNIESALALSIVLIPLLDLGIKYYVGYCFKKEGASCFGRFDRLQVKLSLLSIFLASLLLFFSEFFYILFLSVLRGAHINLYQYGQIKGRLNDDLIRPIIINVVSSVITFVIFFLGYQQGLSSKAIIFCFFIFPPLIFLFISFKNLSTSSYEKSHEISTTIFLSRCLKFSISAIVNTILVVGFANLTKIFVLENFGENEMVQYSFIFRLSMIVQLFHMSIAGYTFKFFLLSKNLKKMRNIYIIYMVFMALISTLFIFCIYIFNQIFNYELLNVDPLFIVVFLYTLLWCFSSFFEFIYIRINKTKLMLINSFVFFSAYIFYYFIFGIDSSLYAAVGLMISAFFMLFSNLILVWLNRNELIK